MEAPRLLLFLDIGGLLTHHSTSSLVSSLQLVLVPKIPLHLKKTGIIPLEDALKAIEASCVLSAKRDSLATHYSSVPGVQLSGRTLSSCLERVCFSSSSSSFSSRFLLLPSTNPSQSSLSSSKCWRTISNYWLFSLLLIWLGPPQSSLSSPSSSLLPQSLRVSFLSTVF